MYFFFNQANAIASMDQSRQLPRAQPLNAPDYFARTRQPVPKILFPNIPLTLICVCSARDHKICVGSRFANEWMMPIKNNHRRDKHSHTQAQRKREPTKKKQSSRYSFFFVCVFFNGPGFWSHGLHDM